MRKYETKIQELKVNILAEVARMTWDHSLDNPAHLLDIPDKIIPGPEANLRCCIYKERAVVSSRGKMAMGGDMVAQQEGAELLEKGMLSTSCCPGYVGFIKKKYPELDHLVSHTPSPMVVTGLWLKEKEPDAKVVFIGPCIAKKKEFQLGRTRNAVDSVLTYEELCALFDSRDIDLTELPEEPLDEASSPRNRIEVENHAKQAGERTIGEAVAAAKSAPVESSEQPAQVK
jgi:iron only hydrogenase large subunit-like protein